MKLMLNSTINEAFADSMPEVIKKFITSGKRYIRMLTQNKNIELSTAEFKEYPVPSSNRDPIFKDESKLVFFVFSENNVYIKGVNEEDNMLIWNNNWTPNKWLPAKALIQNTKAIYYIDLTDPNNFNTQKRDTRASYDLKNDPNRRYSQDQMTGWEWRRIKDKLDKSGYLVDPDRLSKKLIASGMYNPAKKLKGVYKDLQDLKKELQNAMDEVDVADLDYMAVRDAASAIDAIRDGYGYYYRAVQRYSQCISNINDYNRYKDTDPDMAKSYISNNLEDNLRYTKEFINSAYQYINQYIGYAVDWDTDDEQM